MIKKPDPIEFTIPDSNTKITLIHLPVKEKINGVYQITGYKPYMEVAQRLVWFNLIASDYILETEIEKEWEIQGKEGPIYLIRFRATLKDPQGKLLRVARKTKEIQSDKDYETCETGAIGRVLAYWGVGTQYATQDIEEGEDIADAPASLKKQGEKNESIQNTGNIRPTSNITNKTLSNPKTTPDLIIKPRIDVMESNRLLDEPFDSELSDLGKTKFETGINTDKTFSEMFKEELSNNHKWARARLKEISTGKNPPEIAIKYLTYVETLGVNLG